MSEPIIQLRNVEKSYFLANKEEVHVLKGIDMEVQKNEFVALMGTSGGGKSTLLNIIGCLHYISTGQYILDGADISDIRDDSMLAFIRNRKIGFIFQTFNLVPKLNALRNIELPGFYAGMPKRERRERALQLLEDVGLESRWGHKPSELSNGQQQRISIARSLINDPEIILADEPTGALDTKTTIDVMNIIVGLKQKNKTILMVTHTPEVARYADRIVFLQDGKIMSHNYQLPA